MLCREGLKKTVAKEAPLTAQVSIAAAKLFFQGFPLLRTARREADDESRAHLLTSPVLCTYPQVAKGGKQGKAAPAAANGVGKHHAAQQQRKAGKGPGKAPVAGAATKQKPAVAGFSDHNASWLKPAGKRAAAYPHYAVERPCCFLSARLSHTWLVLSQTLPTIYLHSGKAHSTTCSLQGSIGSAVSACAV